MVDPSLVIVREIDISEAKAATRTKVATRARAKAAIRASLVVGIALGQREAGDPPVVS